jgi:hypothetical protein
MEMTDQQEEVSLGQKFEEGLGRDEAQTFSAWIPSEHLREHRTGHGPRQLHVHTRMENFAEAYRHSSKPATVTKHVRRNP